MNYQKNYKEKHHVIPRCMGGGDEFDNLVELTPEEHFLAHQLLVKIHPDNESLVYAANMMCVGSNRNNKRYGWLKRKFSITCKHRIGEKNGSFGSFWINDGVVNKRIKGKIPEGFSKGKITNRIDLTCEHCGSSFNHYSGRKYCTIECAREINGKKMGSSTKGKSSYKIMANNEIIESTLIDCNYDVELAMVKLGYKPKSYGNSRKRFIEILNKLRV